MEFSDLVAIHTLELNKLPKITDGTQLYDWAKFIAANNEKELTMVADRNPQIEQAVVKLRRLSDDERARDLYERREKGRRDYVSVMKFEVQKATKKSRLEGKREGKRESQLKTAKTLIKMGLPVNKIVEATDLTSEEIARLVAELKH